MADNPIQPIQVEGAPLAPQNNNVTAPRPRQRAHSRVRRSQFVHGEFRGLAHGYAAPRF